MSAQEKGSFVRAKPAYRTFRRSDDKYRECSFPEVGSLTVVGSRCGASGRGAAHRGRTARLRPPHAGGGASATEAAAASVAVPQSGAVAALAYPAARDDLRALQSTLGHGAYPV